MYSKVAPSGAVEVIRIFERSSKGAISEGVAIHNTHISTPAPIKIKGASHRTFIKPSNSRR